MVKTKNSIRTLLFLLPLALIVAVSGCVTPSTSGIGVVINTFQSDFTTINSGDTLSLLLEVENTGEIRAQNVRAELTGISAQDWGSFIDVQDLGSLLEVTYQPDGTAVKGQVKTAKWNELRAPSLVRGMQHTYTPEVRVSYDYATVAQKPITIVDKDELRNIILSGEGLPSSKATSYSSGPINVEIAAASYVQTTDIGTGTTYDIFPINVHIENMQFTSGSTVVKPITGGGTETYPIYVTIEPPSGTSFVHSGGQYTDCSQFVIVDLFKGRDADITCELEVTNPPSISQEGLITVNLEYRYALGAQTSVSVIGI